MTRNLLAIAFFLISLLSAAQTPRRAIETQRIHEPIKIDGMLDEASWKLAKSASDFIQLEPFNGKPSAYHTEVKILYTDYAIYFGAEMHDEHPDSIMKQLTQRDEMGQSDFFGLTIDAFNDGLNSLTFVVTPANVQFDARQSDVEDVSWDAVWVSKTRIHDKGWTLEIEIPYSELRFPKKEVQLWGINFARNVQRSRETSFWNFVDAKIEGFLKQMGELHGIRDVEPPLRLSFTPYVSAYILDEAGSQKRDYDLRGGLDLKLGINESYTLDMMLIPDFGQTESDDKELNISAFETYYNEKRPFFTEGAELFNKGEIFYSRRIGAVKNTWQDSDYGLRENEELTHAPMETSLINVSKISGKGKQGLGIGFLNGIGAPAHATLTDTLSGIKRKIRIQPYTNYNVLVFDQSLKNNSYISLANTNYMQPAFNYVSNVTASEMHLETKSGTYAVEGIFGLSYVNDTNQTDSTGVKYQLEIGKIAGNFRFAIQQSLATKTFNQNDMGYLPKTDELETEFEVSYNIYDPFWRLLKWYNHVQYTQLTLFSKKAGIGNAVSLSTFGTFRNYFSLNLESEFTLGDFHDFYEPRVDGWVFTQPGYMAFSTYLSPDYRKKYIADFNLGYWQSYSDNRWGMWTGIMPIIRVNDQLNLNAGIHFNTDVGDVGFVDKTEANDTIYFGRRDVKTLINALNINYNFNADMALSFRARHYWRIVDYYKFYTLNRKGSLSDAADFTTDDISSNYFNIDLVYTWRFAPGSELSLVWKNAIENSSSDANFNYYHNLNKLLDFDKQNSISLRVIYYMDYLKIKQRI